MHSAAAPRNLTLFLLLLLFDQKAEGSEKNIPKGSGLAVHSSFSLEKMCPTRPQWTLLPLKVGFPKFFLTPLQMPMDYRNTTNFYLQSRPVNTH